MSIRVDPWWSRKVRAPIDQGVGIFILVCLPFPDHAQERPHIGIAKRGSYAAECCVHGYTGSHPPLHLIHPRMPGGFTVDPGRSGYSFTHIPL